VFALADAGQQVGWDGDMRHLPMVGYQPVPPDVIPYLVVKQDNNGDTFIITDAAMPYLDQPTVAEITPRSIGAGCPPTPSPAWTERGTPSPRSDDLDAAMIVNEEPEFRPLSQRDAAPPQDESPRDAHDCAMDEFE
jgi:hypothetical protein